MAPVLSLSAAWTKLLKIPAGKVKEGAGKRWGHKRDFHIKGRGFGSGW